MQKRFSYRLFWSVTVRKILMGTFFSSSALVANASDETSETVFLDKINLQGTTFVQCHSRPEGWQCDLVDIHTGELLALDEPQKQNVAYDWRPMSQLTPQQRDALNPGCEGVYYDPMQSVVQNTGNANPDELPLLVEADDSVVTQNEHAELSGNVLVTQGSRLLSANNMSYDLTNDIARLVGNVTIRNPGMLIRGESAQVSATQHQASFEGAMFVLHEPHLRGGAEAIKQNSKSSIELIGGQFTSCEPGDRSWLLEGEKITINTETNQGEAHNVKLKIGSVPILYLPYLSFPVGDERQSGFLFPSVSVSDKYGVDLALPYYWNLAPNYDVTITPRYITKRGAMLEAEGRHLSREFYTVSSFAFLPNDNGGIDPDKKQLIAEGQISEERAAPYKGQKRWLVHLDQLGGGRLNPWQTRIDYSKVSDVDYFNDIGATSFSVQTNTHLNQAFSAGYEYANWNISALYQDYQMLLYNVDDPYRRAPQINLDGYYRNADLGLKLQHEYTRFDHKNPVWNNGRTIIKGDRLNSDYRLYWNKQAPWGFFMPEVGLQTLSYSLDKETISLTADTSPTVAAGQASLDMGLIFENPQGKTLQTFEPRIYYLYRDYEDHSKLFNVTDDGQFINFDTSERTFTYSQLYRDSRFSGSDRLDDANRVTIGVTTRWFSNDSGRELFTASAGQIFYYDDRRVGLTKDTQSTEESSEIAAESRIALGPFTSAYASGVYDEEQSEFIRSTAGIHYASTNFRRLANISYSYVKDRGQLTGSQRGDIDQVDTSFLTPISREWFVMGRANYDFTNEQELEAFFGLEYNNCCYRIRFLARRWLDSGLATLVDDDSNDTNDDALYDNGIFFEIHLKGLGSSGAKIDTLLGGSIFGYQEREKLINP